MLEIRGLHAGYGPVEILHGIALRVERHGIVSLSGPNTAGKSTLLRGSSRLGEGWYRGEMSFEGKSLLAEPAHRIAGLGIAHVLEGRHIFPRLTVAENLRM